MRAATREGVCCRSSRRRPRPEVRSAGRGTPVHDHEGNRLAPRKAVDASEWFPPPGCYGLTHADLRTTLPVQYNCATGNVEREIEGGTMSKKSCVALTAALLCSALPALSQELPAGPGKELAEANCNICHTLLSRVGSGYTPEGWTTVLQMMHNQGAPLPADQVEPL